MDKEYGVGLNLDLTQFKMQVENIRNITKKIKEKGVELDVNTDFNENNIKTSIDEIEREVKDLSVNIENDLSESAKKVEESFSGLGETIGNVLAIPGMKTKLFALGGAVIFGIFRKIRNEIEKTKKQSEELKKSIAKLSVDIIKSSNKGVSSLKNFAISLFGIQTAYRNVSKAVSAYLSFDKQLSQSISNTWAGFGSFLAPVLEYIVNLFAQILAYANAVIYTLTGINYVAKANAKAMANTSKAIGGVIKQMKILSSFDEITNINQDTGSSGGTGSVEVNQIELPEINMKTVEKIIKIKDKIKELLEKEDWTDLGATISLKISEILNKINWEKVKAGAKDFGSRLASLLNGLILSKDANGNTLGTNIATSLAEAFNSAILFLHGFIKKLNWKGIGKEIANSINNAIEKIDWAETGEFINDLINDLLDLAINFIEGLDYNKISNAIVSFIQKIDIEKIKKKITLLMLDIWQAVNNIQYSIDMANADSDLQKIWITTKYAAKIAAYNRIKEMLGLDEETTSKVIEDSKGVGENSTQAVIDGATENKEEMQEAGQDILFSFFTGANNTIQEETPVLKDEMNSSGYSSTSSFIDGVNEPDVETPVKNIGASVLSTIRKTFNIQNGQSSETKTQGIAVAGGFVGGIDSENKKNGANAIFTGIKTETDKTLSNMNKQTQKNGLNVGSSLKNGIWEGFSSGLTSIINKIKGKLNSIIGLFNTTSENINKKFNIKTFANVASDVAGTTSKLFGSISATIGRIPFLRVGTDDVYSEGLAYLHAGEKVVPADVAKGGYTGSDNEETNNLLRQLIELIDDKDFNPYVTVEDIGKASVNYINKKKRITGEAII